MYLTCTVAIECPSFFCFEFTLTAASHKKGQAQHPDSDRRRITNISHSGSTTDNLGNFGLDIRLQQRQKPGPALILLEIFAGEPRVSQADRGGPVLLF